MKKDELFAHGGVCLFFAFMLYQATALKFVRRVGDMGSGFWPILILSTALALSILLLIGHVRKYRQEQRALTKEATAPTAAKDDTSTRRKKLVLTALCLLAYILIMPYIGFIVATFVYVLAFVVAIGERRKWVLVSSPVLLTVLIVVVFLRFIAMPLPKGIGMFAGFSRFFY
jgi:putative tricarboxylic transport membrane protein